MQENKHLNIFLKIGMAEGISFLVLLFVAMPLKYFMDMPLMVKYVGWAHGLLFILYIAYLILAANEQKWKFKTMVMGFFASLLPFGPFIFENRIKAASAKIEQG